MLWIIIKDHINARLQKIIDAPLQTGRVFTRAKSRQDAWRAADAAGKEALRTAWKKECNFEFRLYDDDGELYYEGVCKDLDQMGGDDALAPRDWAMAADGVTRMDYRKKGEKEWKIL